MYIPGRSLTCSTPSRTWVLLESYSCAAGFFLGVLFVVTVATGLRSCPRSGPALTGRPRRGTALRGCVHLTNRGRRTARFHVLFQAFYLLFRTTTRTVSITSEPSA